jgi:CRP-like cAMP-binding protein
MRGILGPEPYEKGDAVAPRLGFGAGFGSAPNGPRVTLASLQQLAGYGQYFKRDAVIYREGSQSKYWYQVVSGTVRLVTFFADGQRYIQDFYRVGGCFGSGFGGTCRFAADAVTDCILRRYPHRTTGQLIEELPELARQLWNMHLKELDHAQSRSAILGG